jgi:F-type H+-transporting ATPase subunit epsilon
MSEMQCVVVTPEMTVLESPAEFVALPLYDGEVGVAPRHAPMIGRLGYGEMRLTSGGQVRRFYVDGGFVQVAHDVVSVLTNRAIPLEDLDPEAAARQLSEAQHRTAHSPEMMAIRDRMEQQARAQIRLAKRRGPAR